MSMKIWPIEQKALQNTATEEFPAASDADHFK